MAENQIYEKAYLGLITLSEFLIRSQGPDGAWHFALETGTITDAYMIILLRHLQINDEIYIGRLADRILAKQEKSGAWKLFYDEPDGNLSATIECYYALLLAGRNKEDPEMVPAREFILSRGGPSKAGSLTRVMLALTGNYPWSGLPGIPPEIILLPTWLPVNFFDLVGYTRVHSAPLLICANLKFSLKLPGGPDLSDIFTASSLKAPSWETPPALQSAIDETVSSMAMPRSKIRSLALRSLERFMLQRTEWDGTLYSYFTTTFLMIFSLMALGYDRGHPVIIKAVAGAKEMTAFTGSYYHVQETTATVWNTALIAYALQEAGISFNHPAIERSTRYLWSKQQTRAGDWQVHNHLGRPGGWGFSHSNTINPDIDDTSYSLRALYRQCATCPEKYGPAWHAGVEWLLSMQNDDGGWPAFEKNTDKKWPDILPIPDAKPVLTDPPSADLTGRTVEFLCRFARMSIREEHVQNGVKWLLGNQERDGSWYGRWGISYIYGAWAAVTGLTAAGIGANHRSVVKAVNWLMSVRNPDGGWGESCLSDVNKTYTALGFSTPSQTAWALDALIAAGKGEDPAVARGIECLAGLAGKSGIEQSYPTGAGLPGGFYINYHSYRYIWPLLALGHYLKASNSI